MKKLFLLLLFATIPAITQAAKNLPNQIHIVVKGSEKSAIFFKDSLLSALADDVNIVLMEAYNLSNYTETADTEKFIKLNRLQGLVRVTVRKTDDGFEATVKAFSADSVLLDKTILFNAYNLLDKANTIADEVSAKFPMREQKVLVREDIEEVLIGKFEYTRPTLFVGLGIGWFKNYMGVYAVEEFGVNKVLLNAEFNFRYKWWGLYASIDFVANPFFAYNHPQFGLELNLAKGIVTLRAKFGFVNFQDNYTSLIEPEGNIYTNTYKPDFSYLTLAGDVYINISQKYAVLIGMSFAPLQGGKDINFDGYYKDDDGQTNYANTTVSLGNFISYFDSVTIAHYFKISPKLTLANKWKFYIPSQWEKENGHVIAMTANVWVNLALIYRFDFGGLK